MPEPYFVTEQIKANARRLPAEDGQDSLLNLSAIVVDFHIHPNTFRGRQAKGWPALAGRPIDPHPERQRWEHEGKAGWETLYLKSRVAEALKPLEFDGYYPDTPIEAAYNTERACRELGEDGTPLNPSTLQKLVRRGFRVFGGVILKLEVTSIPNPVTGHLENAHSVASINAILKGRSVLKEASGAGRHEDAKGAWLAVSQTIEKVKPWLKATHEGLKDYKGNIRSTLMNWQEYCQLIGRKLDHKLEPNEHQDEVTWYFEKDVLDIVKALQDRANGVYRDPESPEDEYLIPAAAGKKGIDARARARGVLRGNLKAKTFPRRHGGPRRKGLAADEIVALRKSDLEEAPAPVKFDGLYKRSDGRPARNIVAASQYLTVALGFRVPINTLNRYLGTCEYLSERLLPSELMTRLPPAWLRPGPGGGVGRQEATVLDEDLDRLAAAMRATVLLGRDVKPQDGLLTSGEIGQRYRLRERSDRIALGILLYRLTVGGQLERKKTQRFSKKRRMWYKPFGYDVGQFDLLLGGRSIREVVREFAAGVQKKAGFRVALVDGRLLDADEASAASATPPDAAAAREAFSPPTRVPHNQQDMTPDYGNINKPPPVEIGTPQRLANHKDVARSIGDDLEGRTLRVVVVQDRRSQDNPPDPTSIISHGESLYSIGTEYRVVTEREDTVLQPFLERPAMTNKQLGSACGMTGEEAAKVLKDIRVRYDGVFAPAITPAGARDTGGHRVNILRKPTTSNAAAS